MSTLDSRQPPRLQLSYHPPYHVQSVLHFFAVRAVPGLECVTTEPDGSAAFARVFQIQVQGHRHVGWVHLQFEENADCVSVGLSDTLLSVAPAVLQQTCWALDLDADCKAIDAALTVDFPHCLGWRVPGAWDGFETAVRAVLGQQITVTAARTLTKRLVHTFGVPVSTPWPELTHAFPTPQVLLQVTEDELGQLGIIKQRQKAIHALAHAVLHEGLVLNPGPQTSRTVEALMQLPGIGDWTAQYIAMRCLRWPDAFPAGDVAIQNCLDVRGHKKPALEAVSLAKKWQPWRSYAVIRLWHGGF